MTKWDWAMNQYRYGLYFAGRHGSSNLSFAHQLSGDSSSDESDRQAECRRHTGPHSASESGRAVAGPSQRKKRCPICQVVFPVAEYRAHYAQEVDKLMREPNGRIRRTRGAVARSDTTETSPSSPASDDAASNTDSSSRSSLTSDSNAAPPQTRLKRHRTLVSSSGSASNTHRRTLGAKRTTRLRKTSSRSSSSSSSRRSTVADSNPKELSREVDRSMNPEVSIYTKGTAVPHSAHPQTCFMCNAVIDGTSAQINAHIDKCLGKTNFVEYEWAGQTRVRATAMLEGGVTASGLGSAAPSSNARDVDEDVDVDEEDETNFGRPQYSNSDLITANESRAKDDAAANPQFEYCAPPLGDSDDDDSAQSRVRLSDGDALASENIQQQQQQQQHLPMADGASQLIINALKERIRQQDRLLQSTHKCLICLEPYAKPCASINCWHVYCEKCWLHTLGTKKLCPQCLQITQPTDLRRVYL